LPLEETLERRAVCPVGRGFRPCHFYLVSRSGCRWVPGPVLETRWSEWSLRPDLDLRLDQADRGPWALQAGRLEAVDFLVVAVVGGRRPLLDQMLPEDSRL
jgi:hypothetical protein